MSKEIREAAKLFRAHEKYGRSSVELFRDFVSASFNALYKPIELEPGQGEAREAAYMAIVERYAGYARSATVIRDLFPQALALCTIVNLRKEDFLGGLAQELEVLNRHQGQFFTPAGIAMLSAKAQLDAEFIARKRAAGERITLLEPAAGAGVMLIEAARHLEDMGVDLSREVTMYAIDISPMAFQIASIQMMLCEIPAVIYQGSGLSANIEANHSDKVVTRALGARLLRESKARPGKTATAAE